MGGLYTQPVNAKLLSIKFIRIVAVIDDNSVRCVYSLPGSIAWDVSDQSDKNKWNEENPMYKNKYFHF